MKFEITPQFKDNRRFVHIYLNEKDGMKKVLDFLVNSKNVEFNSKELEKVFGLKGKKFKDLLTELEMLGLIKE